ncbi:MAG: hypothetical protein R2750_09970 [Bacteroidales bacterium]
MKIKYFVLFIFVSFLSCDTGSEENAEDQNKQQDIVIAFDEAKLKTIDGKDFPYRDKMLNNILYNDTIRALNKDEILDLLGEPTRINENYLYYMISQTRLGSWPLSTKTLVIKFAEDNTIEWIRVHE